MISKNIILYLINNSLFGKTVEDVRNQRHMKLAKTEERRNYLVSEPKCYTTIFLSDNLLPIQIKRT